MVRLGRSLGQGEDEQGALLKAQEVSDGDLPLKNQKASRPKLASKVSLDFMHFKLTCLLMGNS